MSEQQTIEAFLQGQEDCKNGVPHESGKGEDYDRGYSAQYHLEQIRGEMRHGLKATQHTT